jgi:hypothetical protein
MGKHGLQCKPADSMDDLIQHSRSIEDWSEDQQFHTSKDDETIEANTMAANPLQEETSDTREVGNRRDSLGKDRYASFEQLLKSARPSQRPQHNVIWRNGKLFVFSLAPVSASSNLHVHATR